MITLYTFGPYFGLPDASPFVMKGEMLLKLSGLPYEARPRGLRKAPKGKLPYIRDGDTVVADSTLIRLYLEQKYSIDFDRDLPARERGTAWSVEKMLEDHFYWLLVYWRWVDDANFDRGSRVYFQRAPALIRPLAIYMVRRKVRANLRAHGLGRHSEQETTVMANRAIDALAAIHGDNRYFLGSTPCGADATVFAFLASALTSNCLSPLRDRVLATPNLKAYCERMMQEFYPAFVAS